MIRQLSRQELEPFLNPGKTVEVFLGRCNDDKEVIAWVSLHKAEDKQVEVTYHEVYDEGSLAWLDVYSFYHTNPEETEFSKRQFHGVEEAVRFLMANHGLTQPHFFTAGGIQVAYELLLRSEGMKSN